MASDMSKSAFPRPHSQEPGGAMAWEQPGMTLREWYAGLAMQGALASMDWAPGQMPSDEELPGIARGAVRAADALLAALAEGG